MEGEVKFDDGNTLERPSCQNDGPSKITGLVMKLGLASSEEKANRVLLWITAIVFIISVLIFYNSTKSSKGPPVNQQTVQQMMQLAPRAN